MIDGPANIMSNHFNIEPSHRDHVELLQITDTHIFADEKETLDGIDTQSSLKEVLNLARKNDWPVDAVLVTGDLAHDPVTVAYERLLELLTNIGKPVFCIPGNHDDPDVMFQVLNKQNVHTSKSLEIGQWLIIMLDTFMPNTHTHAGYLIQDELDFLDNILNENLDKHVLVCLHHPPVEIGSVWMDSMRLNNPEDFFNVLDEYDHIKAVLWGHIHQEFTSERHGVTLMATPSTCVQFMPGAGQYTKDGRAAGYRHLRLNASGEINSVIRRLNEDSV